jgi:hypothetical protein
VYRDLRPNDTRPVQVLVGDRWYDGWLEAYRRGRDGRWVGWVRWSERPGYQHVGWYDEAVLRRPVCATP